MWFFVQNGSQQGPVSQEEIQSLIGEGKITSVTLVWQQGMDNWLRITETELKHLLPNDTPPPIPDDIPPPIPNTETSQGMPQSNTATNYKLEPVRLIKDAFGYAGRVYFPMLALFVPSQLGSILAFFALLDGSAGLFVLLSLICFTCIFPFVTGASIFYVHKNLTGQGASIADSVQIAVTKLVPLILVTFILYIILIIGFICFFIPGIYLSIRLSFVYYAVIIENRSAVDALRRSWQLTNGFWWQIFMAALIFTIIIGIPLGVFAVILEVAIGGSSPILSNSVSSLIGLLISPILAVYYVFLFMSLVNIAGER